MKKIYILVVLALALASCQSDHHVTVKNDTNKSVLKYTLPDGTKVELDFKSDVTPETLISLNTALANSQIQAMTFTTQQHIEDTRQQIFDLTRFGAALLAFVMLMGGLIGVFFVAVIKGNAL